MIINENVITDDVIKMNLLNALEADNGCLQTKMTYLIKLRDIG